MPMKKSTRTSPEDIAKLRCPEKASQGRSLIRLGYEFSQAFE